MGGGVGACLLALFLLIHVHTNVGRSSICAYKLCMYRVCMQLRTPEIQYSWLHGQSLSVSSFYIHRLFAELGLNLHCQGVALVSITTCTHTGVY